MSICRCARSSAFPPSYTIHSLAADAHRENNNVKHPLPGTRFDKNQVCISTDSGIPTFLNTGSIRSSRSPTSCPACSMMSLSLELASGSHPDGLRCISRRFPSRAAPVQFTSDGTKGPAHRGHAQGVRRGVGETSRRDPQVQSLVVRSECGYDVCMKMTRRELISSSVLPVALMMNIPGSVASAKGKDFLVYVGTYTNKNRSKGIYAFRFDAGTGKLDPLGLVGEMANPSFVAIHSNNRWLYAVSEMADGHGKTTGSVSSFLSTQRVANSRCETLLIPRATDPASSEPITPEKMCWWLTTTAGARLFCRSRRTVL